MKTQLVQEIKRKRIEKLFKDCQETIVNTSLSAFGLNRGMFTDHNGGNVTTLHNFEKNDKSYVQERDHDSYDRANKQYRAQPRSKVDPDTQVSRDDYEVSTKSWNEKKENAVNAQNGVDAYTGQNLEPNNTDLDHIVPIEKIHKNKKIHLAHNTGTQEGKNKVKEIVNNEKNLAATSGSVNKSKGGKTNSEYVEQTSSSRKKELNVNDELMLQKEQEAEAYIESETNKALFKKQSQELLKTGGQQALAMGVKQALGLVITDLISITFSEIKLMLREGLPLDLPSLNKLKSRVFRHLQNLFKKIPNILSESIKGGVSGFLSNLLTFIINNFISTAKKVVTMIREGLLGIYKAFKMLFFPPKGMEKHEVWANAIKILTTTLITSGSLLLSEVVSKFLETTLPILAPISNEISSVFTGIIGGLASAIVAYMIDLIFDKLSNRHDEYMIDLLMENADERGKLADFLLSSMNVGLKNIEKYHKTIKSYNDSQAIYKKANISFSNVSESLKDNLNLSKEILKETQKKIVSSNETVKYIKETQPKIEDFLRKY